MSTETPDKPQTEVFLGKTDYKVIGTRPIRHDGAEKVTGKAIYTADFKLPGMLHGAILRSPHPHANIKSIDTSAAEAMDGVMAVITAADMPGLKDKNANLGEGSVNLLDLGRNVLAHGKVLYRGHAVAAVAAKTVHIAQEAIKHIKVEYEELPAVTWVLDAMKEDAPILLDRVRTDDMGKMSDSPTNVAKHIRFEKGDIDDGFSQCDIVIEKEFRTETVHQGYIEPHASVASWNEDGHLKIWTATQGSFTARQQTAELLELPVSKVTVTPCEIGGGFGGKIAVYTQPVAALLSQKSGRPVKVTMQRNEVFEGTGPTPGSYMKVKLGATNDGKLVAGEAWLAYDAGAFPGGVIGPGCMCVFSCYDFEHAKVDGYDVLVNKPKTQAYRAPGSTHVAFAVETIVDEIAEKLERDPIDFRIQNAAKEGTVRVDGLKYPRIGLVETLEALKNSDHYQSKLEGPNKGRGLGCGFWFNIGLKSSVTATVNSDGMVSLIEGSTDIGGTRTSIAMQFAETLGIPAEDVIPKVADTDSIGYTDVTGGSRVTFSTGLAAYKCALDIQDQLRARAAELWDCEPENVTIEEGVYSHNGDTMTFKELAEKASQVGDPVAGSATVSPDCFTNGFAAHLADVEVDPETGKVTILRYTAVQDAGKAIHPSYVEGQMQGGAVQGIGWALNEEYFYDEAGNMKNASYLDYRMPTCLDVPMIETIIVEVPNPDHPYGVRGVGEPPICPPPGAIANAIYHATGVRMTQLPISPPKLWKAISEK
jgi:CO/xanthine dehydrogenase Mo-binding subunit